jgi:hypothetical protein
MIPVLFLGLLVAGGGRQPSLRDSDRIRLAEAFHLAQDVQDSIWTGWSEVPFAVLLVTPEHEFLVRHPHPSSDFTSLGYDSLVGSEVYARPTSGRLALNLLATFPAVQGVNTVVMGQPEHTGKSSTFWVVTALHEHFHQLQYTRPDYAEAVAALGLSGGDETGMWQLNYPFPYDSSAVREPFVAYKGALERALAAAGGPEERERARDYVAARRRLREALGDADFRYLSFQIWQEGVARYTELAVARAAAEWHEPLPAFRALEDFVPYAAAADTLRGRLVEEMATLDLASWERLVFYPVGAVEALLLDVVRPGWRQRYFTRQFDLESPYE